jgi:hypothetical protein
LVPPGQSTKHPKKADAAFVGNEVMYMEFALVPPQTSPPFPEQGVEHALDLP